MTKFEFDRECRTASSECYTIISEGSTVGRFDVHFTPNIVHGTLVVVESLTKENIQDLIEVVDEEIVDMVGVERDELIVHIHQGRDLGVFSNHEFGPTGNGYPPTGA